MPVDCISRPTWNSFACRRRNRGSRFVSAAAAISLYTAVTAAAGEMNAREAPNHLKSGAAHTKTHDLS